MSNRVKSLNGLVGFFVVLGGCLSLGCQVISSKGPTGYTISTFVPDGTLRTPTAVEADASGNIYVVDSGNYVVRKYNTAGVGQVLAGTPGVNQKYTAQNVLAANRVPGGCYTKTGVHCQRTQAILSSPRDVAIDKNGNVFISDISAGKIKKVDGVTGVLTTYAGGHVGGWSATQLHGPAGLAIDKKGDIYVADKVNNAIRKIIPPVAPATIGTIVTIAGLGPDQPGCAEDGAVAANSRLDRPQDVAIDAAGNLYVADTGCRKVRKISIDGTISTIVGTGAEDMGTPPEVPFSSSSEVATAVNLANPVGLALDKKGNLVISDAGFDVLWYYNAARGTLQVLAGLAPQASICSSSTNPQGDGCHGDAAFLNMPSKPAFDASGNIYIPEEGGTKSPTHPFTVRILTPSGS